MSQISKCERKLNEKIAEMLDRLSGVEAEREIIVLQLAVLEAPRDSLSKPAEVSDGD